VGSAAAKFPQDVAVAAKANSETIEAVTPERYISAAIWRFPNSISTGIGGIMLGMGLLALPFYVASLLYIASISLFWYYFRGAKVPEEARQQSSP
jgi:hypothetical protein